jgi:hypothetical protein
MEHLIFSSDGFLRARLGEGKPALPLFFLKNESNKSNINFMSYWMTKKVIFEEGLTIGSFLQNLEPFQDYLNEYLGKKISSYIKESKKLISVEKRKNFDWIALFHTYTISEEFETNQNKELLLVNKWKIYENYSLAGYFYNNNEHYGIEKFSIASIQHIPLFLDKNTRVIINEKEVQGIDKERRLLNKNAFGVMSKKFHSNFELQYLLSEKEHSFREVIEGFFKNFNIDIDSRTNEIEMLENFMEILEEQNKQEDMGLKIYEGQLLQSINEMNEKESKWKNCINKANKNNILITIGKIKEGKVPENKLYGTTIEEKIQKIKIK